MLRRWDACIEMVVLALIRTYLQTLSTELPSPIPMVLGFSETLIHVKRFGRVTGEAQSVVVVFYDRVVSSDFRHCCGGPCITGCIGLELFLGWARSFGVIYFFVRFIFVFAAGGFRVGLVCLATRVGSAALPTGSPCRSSHRGSDARRGV
jgi:hypothetical protein